MVQPKVSFVVPCYKLAHLLPDCINSILSQSFGDFEILVMDDCSPDGTRDVVESLSDGRIRYLRNDQNLGHLRNYNKGINLSRGKYVWLISADDYLRKPYVLERYVDLLERHPTVGYVFCPSVGVRDGAETRVFGQYTLSGDKDRILRGHGLLKKLVCSNFVMTPSGLVRRDCYDTISVFPLDMPWCGDWYLWCLFALYRDVAYFAEPMVCYREHHNLSMTSQLTREKLDACVAEELSVPWTIRQRALELGSWGVAKNCLYGVAQTYARVMVNERYRGASFFMNVDKLEESLRKNARDESEKEWVLARVYEKMGNECYWQNDVAGAKRFYVMSLKADGLMIPVYLKMLLLAAGRPGDYLRQKISALR